MDKLWFTMRVQDQPDQMNQMNSRLERDQGEALVLTYH